MEIRLDNNLETGEAVFGILINFGWRWRNNAKDFLSGLDDDTPRYLCPQEDGIILYLPAGIEPLPSSQVVIAKDFLSDPEFYLMKLCLGVN